MDFLVYGGSVVTMGRLGVVRDGAVLVEGDRIVEVGRSEEVKRRNPRGYERIDAEGKIIIPGLVNTHHHLAMSLLRGYADDLPLKEWLEKWIWPVESLMTGEDIYLGAKLTAVESVLGGCTTVNTMYHYAPEFNEARAIAEVGIRGVVGHVCFSWRKDEDIRLTKMLVEKWHGAENGRVRVSVDPHAPYTVDPGYMRELWSLTSELNEKYRDKAPVIWHIHLAETMDEAEKVEKAFNVDVKDGVVVYLDRLGVLGPIVIAAHCVHLTDKDIAVLASRDVKVSHNPVSNLKLGSGISPVPRLLESGVTVGLGTDSVCSNNSSDMFETMKLAALIHKGVSMNPALMDAWRVLRMATIDGARALNWSDEIGSIEPGKKADLVIIDAMKPHMRPMYSEVSHLVYAAKYGDVETVFVDGRPIVENREVKTVDVEELITQVSKARDRLMEKVRR
ncbi:N-ethylammeline chlorohydrolase [Candidatus Bathyarchaeota archaeon]|nr:MAG: N-ethylammeline chlorohydrolase [Candidatus Bathyarchaeota archaeon]